MGRHRIEIEFDSDAGGAEWLYDILLRLFKCNVGVDNAIVDMTPVVNDPT